MPWVKQNYDRFLLALFAAALAACAGLLFNNARHFNAVFASLKDQVKHSTTFPGVNQSVVESEEKQLAAPATWDARMVENLRLPLFVSPPYIADHEKLINPLEVSSAPLHPPIPNKWLLDHGQDLLSPNVLEQDSDGDGFSTLDEFNGNTDPLDKNSHPPYWTKLALTRFVRIPFRFRFDAKNGDTIQINTVDVEESPTRFLKVGQMVPETKFKVVKFEAKSVKDSGMTRDVSEVTLENQETHEQIILPKAQEVDSPTTYAVLNYLWTGKPFAVKKNQEFTLPPEAKNKDFSVAPEDKVKYKCLDLNESEVRILKEDDQKDLHIKMQAGGRK